jgi:hypothetical protein
MYTLTVYSYISHTNIIIISSCTKNLDEQYTVLVLQQLNNLLNSSRECDVNLTAVASILSLVVMEFGNQTVERSISEVRKKKDNPLLLIFHYMLSLTHTHAYAHTHTHTHTH